MPGSSFAQTTRTQGLAAICAHGCALVALAIPALNLYAWGTASPEGLVLQHKLPDNLALFLPQGLHPGQRVAGRWSTSCPPCSTVALISPLAGR